MVHFILKPYNFLMYFLAIMAFFFLGVSYAGLTGAAKNQMLAGGAIVLGYGLAGTLMGLTQIERKKEQLTLLQLTRTTFA